MSDHATEFIEAGTTRHANRHIAKFLELPENNKADVRNPVQLVQDGRSLTLERLLRGKELSLTKPILVLDKPTSIGMKMLEFPRERQVTVRDIADLLGHHYPVHVIDVEHQEELEGWTLADLVEYFEDEERLALQHRHDLLSSSELNKSSGTTRRRRKAAEKCRDLTKQQRPRVLNQISLEFSKTALSDKIQSPQFVRDIDWIDNAWPRQRNSDGKLRRAIDEVYPNVQYYCLTSAAGCYTDFHLDFGGTSVWYHILSGEKIFCLIPPTKENLSVYEDWLCRPDQAELFLPDLLPNPNQNVIRISLKASQTLVIPTAWIHAVYTPSDSVVIGGNFLHGLDIPLQLEVHCIETRTRVQEKFRFPYYLPINFYAGGYYLDKLRKGQISQREFDGLEKLIEALEEWWKVHSNANSQLQTGPTVLRAASESAENNGCVSVEEFLAELRKEHQRVKHEGVPLNPFPMQPPDSTVVSNSSLTAKSNPTLSTHKPKLRLSLKGPSSRSHPESEPSTALMSVDKKNGDEESSEFRIVVSSSNSSSSRGAPAPTRPKRPREDTEWMDDGLTGEDEWVPDTKLTRARPTPKTSQAPSRPPRAVPSAPAKPQPKPTTSRERLMKRFR